MGRTSLKSKGKRAMVLLITVALLLLSCVGKEGMRTAGTETEIHPVSNGLAIHAGSKILRQPRLEARAVPAPAADPFSPGEQKPAAQEEKPVAVLPEETRPARSPEEPAAKPAAKTPEKVAVKAPFPVKAGNRSQPQVSITFDDGYSKAAVEHVLKALKEEKVAATFFIIGTVLAAHPELWKQAVQEGHQVCNHTYSHQFLGNLPVQEAKKAIQKWEATAVNVLGQSYVDRMKKGFPYFRLPGGNGSAKPAIMQLIADCGYIPIGWDVETCYSVLRHYDLKKCDLRPVRERIVEFVVSNTRNGSIVLLHFNEYDIPRLEDTLKGIREKGFQLVTVSELLSEEALQNSTPADAAQKVQSS